MTRQFKMTEKEFVKRAPDYKGDGVAVWIKTSQNGKKYLSIKVLGSINIAAFKNEPKEVQKKEVPKEIAEVNMGTL